MAKTTNQKSINFGTINTVSMDVLSAFNVARVSLELEKARFSKIRKELETKKEEIIKNRETDLAKGVSVDEVTAKYSTMAIETELRKEKAIHEEIVAPFNEAKNNAITAFCTEDLYNAYTETVANGTTSKLSLEITKFLSALGVNTPEKGVSKFAQLMSIRVNGRLVSNGKNFLNKGEYVKNRSQKQFFEQFINEFLEYVVNEKGVVIRNEDSTLSLKQF